LDCSSSNCSSSLICKESSTDGEDFDYETSASDWEEVETTRRHATAYNAAKTVAENALTQAAEVSRREETTYWLSNEAECEVPSPNRHGRRRDDSPIDYQQWDWDYRRNITVRELRDARREEEGEDFLSRRTRGERLEVTSTTSDTS